MNKIITLSIAVLLLAALGTSTSFAAKPLGGGGGKIKVTGASPGEAPQGDTLTVTIAGENFEDESSVTFFVGGTKDKSQISVNEVRFISKTQLEADIIVSSGALTLDYDIEVQATSGRKGKGTTLFKVRQGDYVPLDPAMAVGITTKTKRKGSKHGNLFVFESDGVRNQMIVDRASGNFYNTLPLTWSPDGSKIIWINGENDTINTVSPDGSDEQVILPFDGVIVPHYGGIRSIATTGNDCLGNTVNHLYFQAVISGDADWVTDFYFLDLNDLPSTPVKLTDTSGEDYDSIMMSPSGTEIATWTHELADGTHRNPNARLEIRDICNVGLPVIQSWTAGDLGLPPGAEIHETSWSVDGLLAATVDFPPDYVRDIYLIDLNEEPSLVHAEKITGAGTGIGEGFKNTRARWSPDGKTLVFVSDYHSMYSLDIETGAVDFLHNSNSIIRDIEWRPDWVRSP